MKMRIAHGAAWVLVVIVLLIVLWDVFAWFRGYPTVSAQLREWSTHYPIIPVIVGVLVGHVFRRD